MAEAKSIVMPEIVWLWLPLKSAATALLVALEARLNARLAVVSARVRSLLKARLALAAVALTA